MVAKNATSFFVFLFLLILPSADIETPHESFQLLPYPTKPDELAPVCADISQHVTHGSSNVNLHLDKMLLFLVV